MRALAEAHASLALVAENYDYDWKTAEKEFQRAIQLDPDYATGRQWYAEYLSWQGRFEEALAESDRAQRLDPLSLIMATRSWHYPVLLAPVRSGHRASAAPCSVWTLEFGSREHSLIYALVKEGKFPKLWKKSKADRVLSDLPGCGRTRRIFMASGAEPAQAQLLW